MIPIEILADGPTPDPIPAMNPSIIRSLTVSSVSLLCAALCSCDAPEFSGRQPYGTPVYTPPPATLPATSAYTPSPADYQSDGSSHFMGSRPAQPTTTPTPEPTPTDANGIPTNVPTNNEPEIIDLDNI